MPTGDSGISSVKKIEVTLNASVNPDLKSKKSVALKKALEIIKRQSEEIKIIYKE